jgi:hypothetical protein
MPLNAQSPYGHPLFTDGTRNAVSVATVAALKALAAADFAHTHGNMVRVDADGSEWVFHATSSLTGDDIFVVAPTYASAGRWLRKTGEVDIARWPSSSSWRASARSSRTS